MKEIDADSLDAYLSFTMELVESGINGDKILKAAQGGIIKTEAYRREAAPGYDGHVRELIREAVFGVWGAKKRAATLAEIYDGIGTGLNNGDEIEGVSQKIREEMRVGSMAEDLGLPFEEDGGQEDERARLGRQGHVGRAGLPADNLPLRGPLQAQPDVLRRRDEGGDLAGLRRDTMIGVHVRTPKLRHSLVRIRRTPLSRRIDFGHQTIDDETCGWRNRLDPNDLQLTFNEVYHLVLTDARFNFLANRRQTLSF